MNIDIDWSKVTLTSQITESKEFLRYVDQTLDSVMPTEFNINFVRNYDIWYRHLIPLEYFFKSRKEIVNELGLAIFTPSENPDNYIKFFKSIMDDIKKQEYILEKKKLSLDPTNILLCLEINQLSSEIANIKNVWNEDSFQRRLSSMNQDLKDRMVLVNKAKTKTNMEWWTILHSCWFNALQIHFAVSIIFPSVKWNIIKSRGHALVTTADIEQLDIYIKQGVSSVSERIFIADIMKGRDVMVGVWGSKESWIIYITREEYQADIRI